MVQIYFIYNVLTPEDKVSPLEMLLGDETYVQSLL